MKIFITTLLMSLAWAAGAAEFHVMVTGNDANPGTTAAPFRTIQQAANVAQPGDVITVHAGTYREWVRPPRGGTSDQRRITYQAARGEKVEIKGSELVTNWTRVEGDVWKAVLPNSFFGAFNPYGDLIHGDWFDPRGRAHHTGAVYVNGDWLVEAAKMEDVFAPAGTVPTSGLGGYLLNVAWFRPGSGRTNKPPVPADRFSEKHGIKTAPCSEGGNCLGYIENGDWVSYGDVDFGSGADNVEMRAAADGPGGEIELRAGNPAGELLGTCSVPDTGDWQAWETFHAAIKPTSGVRPLCLVFRSRSTMADTGLWFGAVDQENTSLWAQFKGLNPNQQRVEINARRTVFYPPTTGIDYLTVRGFTLRDAATPWAPPTAEQIGVIGTHWSKGWIIESNLISHSTCSGIALGKYGDQWDNTSADTAEGYVRTIQRALTNGWSGEIVGHHLVRNNVISDCEQAGIVGSLGAVFSIVRDNDIHDIHVRRLFSGAEMAGIKFHAAVDVQIVHNHIYRTCLGIWLDWMAQGTRASRNLLHDNASDLFMEVDHGPILVDNNLFLSPTSLSSRSQGGAFVHNLIAGNLAANDFDGRQTPLLKPHSTALAGFHDNPRGDDRFYNDIFVRRADLAQYDHSPLPVVMAGNVFLKGARPSPLETNPIVEPSFDPQLRLQEKADGWHLQLALDPALSNGPTHPLVTTALLGQTVISQEPFENPDGTPLRIETDYFGNPRAAANPTAGPFERPGSGLVTLRVW
ncbi:MAG: carbohydrate-binding protein [Verrucomicrobiota bacterium]|jgi:hypothetical protein